MERKGYFLEPALRHHGVKIPPSGQETKTVGQDGQQHPIGNFITDIPQWYEHYKSYQDTGL